MDIDVEKVAMLARIRLTDEESRELSPQLSHILNYIEILQQVDTTGTATTAHPHDAAMPLRANIVTNANRRDDLQAPAPKIESGLYVVPKVIE
ncbi:MAG: Asp-tRNA(Asn)/Glu-tRNA(Gln) amidotransferase subunit GatC [Mariprofundaceae bacterium]